VGSRVDEGAGLTVTVTCCCADKPELPEQVNPYVCDAVSPVIRRVPEGATAPDQPPFIVHDVALAAVHVISVVPPTSIVLGDALSVTVGVLGGATVSVTDFDVEPPIPLQVMV
jgi:hypothetical protein